MKVLNIPIIYVSHSSSETFLIGHKINFINQGKLVFSRKKKNRCFSLFQQRI